MRRAFARGLSFDVSGESVLALSLPLTVTQAELEAALAILDACLGEEEAAQTSNVIPCASGSSRE